MIFMWLQMLFRRGAIDYLLKPFERNPIAQCRRLPERWSTAGVRRQKFHVPAESRRDRVGPQQDGYAATMQDLERSYDITLEAMGDALSICATPRPKATPNA